MQESRLFKIVYHLLDKGQATASELADKFEVSVRTIYRDIESPSEATELLEQSHKEVLNLAEKFSNEELFSKGVFKWVGGSTLGSYFVSITSSHYNWAIKKLKAHKKNCKNM